MVVVRNYKYDEISVKNAGLRDEVIAATGFYPRKTIRSQNKARSRSETIALARAVYYSWKQAIETGMLEKTETGYRYHG